MLTDDMDRAPVTPVPITFQHNNPPANVEASPVAQQNELDNHKANAPVGDDEEQNYGAAALADEEDAVDALLNMVIALHGHV
jgi:hypothetical protein